MKMKLNSLATAPGDEDESDRRMHESQLAIEAAVRAGTTRPGKAGEPVPGGATTAADVGASASAPVEPAATDATQKAEAVTPNDGGATAADEPEKPDEEQEIERWAAEGGDQQLRPMSELEKMMEVAAGKRSPKDLPRTPRSAAAEKAQSAHARAPLSTSKDLDFLINAMPTTPVQSAEAKEEAGAKAQSSGEQATPANAGQAPQSAGPTAVPAAAATIGDVAGQVIAGTVALPFLALSNAHRHLRRKFSATPAPAQPTPSTSAYLAATKGAPLAAFTTLEKITNQKCDFIERAAANVLDAARDVRNITGYVVWEDAVVREAGKRGKNPADIVAAMRHDPDLAPLREQMNVVWRENPGAVATFRREADVFEKHLRDVREKFANSDETLRSRVTGAMQEVIEGTRDLPGFGKEEGEYVATLAERVREMARMFMELLNALLARLTGRAATQTGPEITG
ncbi:hypothetical protein [Ralstonia sp. ASV6]|uniref:hypothetical protein n=1 Tax=Ralstonia sp. ASV6 TaxID=2795124 RepID=UPI0018EDBEC7|nr:hypothetical protein [Ralstonia sp. ASV6]